MVLSRGLNTTEAFKQVTNTTNKKKKVVIFFILFSMNPKNRSPHISNHFSVEEKASPFSGALLSPSLDLRDLSAISLLLLCFSLLPKAEGADL